MRLISKLAFPLAMTISALGLAACSGGSSSATATAVTSGPPPEVSSITIDVVPTADAVGIYIAQDAGYFKQQGLTVKINSIDGGEYGMGDLQTGAVQLVEGNYVSFVLAQIAGTFAAPSPTNPTQTLPAKPIDMRMIANTSQMETGNQALYVMPKSPYKTVQALVKAHAEVGVNSLNNIGTLLIGSLLVANGDPANALKLVPEIFPEMPGLLAHGVIPAAWLPEPFGTIAQQEFGAVPIADFDQGSLENFPIGTIVGNSTWVAAHPHTVAAFLRAFAEGQQVADTDRQAVETALEKDTQGMTPLIAATMTLDTYPLVMDVPVMQRVPDAMYEFGLIKKPYDIAGMIQPESGEIGG